MSQIKNNEIEGNAAIGRHVAVGGNATIQGNANVKKNLKVEGWLEAKNIKGANKGLFASLAHLRETYPQPHEGWFAGVPASEEDISELGLTVQAGKALFRMYVGIGGEWVCKPLDKLYEIVVDNDKVEKLQEALATLEDGQYSLEVEQTALEKRVDGHDTEISGIQAQQATLATSISANKQAADKALEALEESSSQHASDIEQLQEGQTQQGRRIGDLERRADDQDAKIETLQDYEADTQRLAQKGVGDASVAQRAADNAQDAVDRLHTAVNTLDDMINEIIDDKDSPGGFAMLDDYGHIEADKLPPGIGDIKEFHARVNRVKMEDAISLRNATDAGCLLVYNEDTKRFVLAESISDIIDTEEWHRVTHPLQSESKYMQAAGSGAQAAQGTGIKDVKSYWTIEHGVAVLNKGNFRYYPVWADQALYGSFSEKGAIPESNKIYVCTSDSKGYWWNDGELKGLDAALEGIGRGLTPAVININDLCGEPKVTEYYNFWSAVEALAALEAVSQVTYRKAGMVITYRVSSTEWRTLQLTGDLADFGKRTAWEEFGGADSGDNTDSGVLEAVNKALEDMLTGNLPPRRQDVEFADAILRRVNTALEELLAGNVPLPEQPEQPTTATKGDPLAGAVLRRGVMPSGAEPGEVYCHNNCGNTYCVKGSFHGKDATTDITALFGATFTTDSIDKVDSGSVEITDEGRVILTRNFNDEGEAETAYLWLTKGSSEACGPYLTKNAAGQLVVAPDRGYNYRKASTPPPIHELTLAEVGEGEAGFAHFYGKDGGYYEIQWRRCKYSNGGHNPGKRVTRWRRVKKLRKCGVLRIRRRTRTAVSDWVYYSTYTNGDEKQVYRRI